MIQELQFLPVGSIKNFQPLIVLTNKKGTLYNRKTDGMMHRINLEQARLQHIGNVNNLKLVDKALTFSTTAQGDIGEIILCYNRVTSIGVLKLRELTGFERPIKSRS